MAIQLDDIKDKNFGETLEFLRDKVKELNKNLPDDFESASAGVNFSFADGYDVVIKVGKGVIEDLRNE